MKIVILIGLFTIIVATWVGVSIFYPISEHRIIELVFGGIITGLCAFAAVLVIGDVRYRQP